MTSTTPVLELGDRFLDAVRWACELHRDQSRKGSAIPYVSHLLGAASIVLEQPGADEDEVMAALLHDAIEDQAERTSLAAIRLRFGDKVADIVAACTDAVGEPKPPWRLRKAGYLERLAAKPAHVLRVALADKLHNARAIAADHARVGMALWARFSAPPVAQRWYYTTLAEVLGDRLDNAVAHELSRTVATTFAPLPAEVAFADPDAPRPTWVRTGNLTGAAADPDEVALTVGEPYGHGVRLTQERAAPWAASYVEGTWSWWVEEADSGPGAGPLALFVTAVT